MAHADLLASDSEMELELRYRGPAVEEGRMSARELGPALFGMAEMLERTGEILYGGSEPLRVDVQGSFKQGSFKINFVTAAVQDGLLGGLSYEQLAHIAAVLGLAYAVGKDSVIGLAKSVIGLIRWQRGRKVEKVRDVGEDQVQITVTGGDQVTVNLSTYNVFKDPKVRTGFQHVTEPLKQPGMDALSTGRPDEEMEVIRWEEAPYFAAALTPAIEMEPEEVMAFVEVISPNFREGNKWRFGAAGITFFASIEDEGFLRKVRRKEILFGQGDTLRVRMRVERVIGPRGRPEMRRTILRVLNHFPAPAVTEEEPSLFGEIELRTGEHQADVDRDDRAET